MKNIAFLILFLPLVSLADIKIVEVANGKAVVEFDKDDNVSMQTILIKKDLSLGTCKNESSPSSSISCPACKECLGNSSAEENTPRIHLIGGSIQSSQSKITFKATGDSEKVNTTEIDIHYYRNFEKFALGVSYEYERIKGEDSDSIAGNLSLAGRYQFIENKAPNKFIPFVELRLIGATSSNSDSAYSGTLEGDFSGGNIALGFNYFFNNYSFMEARYIVGSLSGDYKLQSYSEDAELKSNGISLGFGIAFN